jgi:hypothetical protein
MKKGISPLIGWVLLIGFSVSAGLLITTWAINQFDDDDLFPKNYEEYCNQVDLRLSDAGTCLDPNDQEFTLNITNEGAFSIRRITLGRETSTFPLSSCKRLLSAADLTPNTNALQTFEVTANNENYSNIVENDCDAFTLDPLNNIDPFDTHNLTYIEIVPWIKVEEKTFPCSEKGIILNNESLLNTHCA